MQYTKPALTYDQQLDKLIGRGLVVSNRPAAIKSLEKLSYYRLSAYFIPFQDQKDVFKKGVSFEMVMELYEFDRRLRFIYFEAIEAIEIFVRTFLTYDLAHQLGPFGYTDPRNFLRGFNHAEWLTDIAGEIARSKETFIQHYKTKYTAMPHYPIWMAIETFSFGSLSMMYQSLRDRYKRPLSNRANVHQQLMESWLHTLCYCRNICAHHSRLWNKYMAIRPRFIGTWSIDSKRENSLFPVTLVIAHLLREFSIDIQFKKELQEMISSNKVVDIEQMGFPANWETLI